jgi:hypothetical protein
VEGIDAGMPFGVADDGTGMGGGTGAADGGSGAAGATAPGGGGAGAAIGTPPGVGPQTPPYGGVRSAPRRLGLKKSMTSATGAVLHPTRKKQQNPATRRMVATLNTASTSIRSWSNPAYSVVSFGKQDETKKLESPYSAKPLTFDRKNRLHAKHLSIHSQ